MYQYVCISIKDGFIEDDIDPETIQHGTDAWLAHQINDSDKDKLDELTERILKKATQAQHIPRPLHHHEVPIAFMPSKSDYPLWRIGCRVCYNNIKILSLVISDSSQQSGRETMAIASLLATANCEHQLRSAFAKDAIPGYIYLECTMNQKLVVLLKSTPGIIRSQNGGVKRASIDPNENIRLLQSINTRTEFKPGQWILITRGPYKGDLAIVSECRINTVLTFVVPRLLQKHPDGKRKHTKLQPPAQLFDPERLGLHPGKQTFGNLNFVHGLLAKLIAYNSISSHILGIPYAHHCMFIASGHPLIQPAEMPKPLEWSLNYGDHVYQLSQTWQGYITSVDTLYAEVEYLAPNFTEIKRLPWCDIRKNFHIGSYVKVASGSHTGKHGWVVNIDDAVVTIQRPLGDVMMVCGSRTHPLITLFQPPQKKKKTSLSRPIQIFSISQIPNTSS